MLADDEEGVVGKGPVGGGGSSGACCHESQCSSILLASGTGRSPTCSSTSVYLRGSARL